MRLVWAGDGICRPGEVAQDYDVEWFWHRRWPDDPRFYWRRGGISWTGRDDGSSVEHLAIGLFFKELHFRWYVPPRDDGRSP